MNDTIAAITTPIGTAGVSIIRLSGQDSWQIAYKIFKSANKKSTQQTFQHSKFYYGWIIDPQTNNLIDEIVLLAFKSPKSYTTEDIIEIQCHGGYNVTQKILQICLDNGARLAEKGEFTKRAFLGGRIDLTQVEAILDIISAKTDLFSSSAAYNLSGRLSELTNNIRSLLINLLAHINASVDFPDEVDEMPVEEIKSQINNILNSLQEVLTRSTDGTILKQGIKTAIIGQPNVGKSSLFNYLLNINRAIVTNIPGTTRDIIEEYMDIEGIPFILTDTAGIREIKTQKDSDFIESIGIDRTKSAIDESDLILFIYDVTQGITKEDIYILTEIQNSNKTLIKLANKSDLNNNYDTTDPKELLVSAKTGDGIDKLKQRIKTAVLGDNFKIQKDDIYINTRHKECIKQAIDYLNLAISGIDDGIEQDLISIDIKSALVSLDEMVGEVVSEIIIDQIFSQFCVGK